MTFQKLGYVLFSQANYDKFAEELTEKITSILGNSYYDYITTHTDNCEEKEIWLSFSKEDVNFKKLIGELLTQEEYDALVENSADVILFY